MRCAVWLLPCPTFWNFIVTVHFVLGFLTVSHAACFLRLSNFPTWGYYIMGYMKCRVAKIMSKSTLCFCKINRSLVHAFFIVCFIVFIFMCRIYPFFMVLGSNLFSFLERMSRLISSWLREVSYSFASLLLYDQFDIVVLNHSFVFCVPLRWTFLYLG